ncbi:MAG: hypothetical protein PHD00_08125 [Bacteroidales bacterium]|nr:hypothetical protein [Bacteroidales bacterium]
MNKLSSLLLALFLALSANSIAQSPIYTLAPDQEMVYGKVGLFDNGEVKYTFAVVRSPHSGKQIYKREFMSPYGGGKPVYGGSQMRVDNNPSEYDFYDYWVIFNGREFGPYDRIYEMHQDDGNVDSWVSDDGKSITFTGVKGQRYYPVIASRPSSTFWSVNQAPDCDPVAGKWGYILQWSQNDYRLFVDGRPKLTGWKRLKGLKYSYDGSNVVYCGKEPGSDDYFVYLNHEKFAGPYYVVSEATFIPNTNILCVDGFGFESVNNRAVYNHGNVLVGDSKIPIPDDHSVGKFYFAGDWVSFTVSRSNKSENVYEKASYWIYEFNYKTRQLLKHDGFAHMVSTFTNGGDTFYYSTFNSKGDRLLVKQGGEIIHKLLNTNCDGYSILFRVNPNGEYITGLSNTSKNTYKVMLNGKPLSAAGNKVKGTDVLGFCPEKHTIQLIVNKDQSVASKSRKYVIGDNIFELDGDFSDINRVFPAQSNDIFHIQRFIIDRNDWRYQLFKNDKCLTEVKWSSIAELTTSLSGSRYAALVTQKPGVSLYGYYSLNPHMHIKRQLLVDGRVMGDTFGAPVWSEQRGKFLVLQEKNGRIMLTEL